MDMCLEGEGWGQRLCIHCVKFSVIYALKIYTVHEQNIAVPLSSLLPCPSPWKCCLPNPVWRVSLFKKIFFKFCTGSSLQCEGCDTRALQHAGSVAVM